MTAKVDNSLNLPVDELFREFDQKLETILEDVLQENQDTQQDVVLRRFTTKEVSQVIGVSDQFIRNLITQGEIPGGELLSNNRREFTIDEINAIRAYLHTKDEKRDHLKPFREQEVCATISIANFKGGVSKSTFSVHLSQYLALRGYRVCLVDLDPQGSSTSLFSYLPNIDFDEAETLVPFMLRDAPNRADDEFKPVDLSYCCHKTHWGDNLYLIPGNTALSEIEAQFPAMQMSVPNFYFWQQLKIGLDTIRHNFDVILLDYPPSLGYSSMCGIYASDGLFVPLPPNMLDFASSGSFFRNLADITQFMQENEGRSLDLKFCKILATQCPIVADTFLGQATEERRKATQSYAIMNKMMQSFGDNLMENSLLQSESIRDASKHFKSVFEMEKHEWDVARQTQRRGLDTINNVCGEAEKHILQALNQKLDTVE